MKYPIIYADPPWSYNDKATAGKRGAEFKYPCMSLDAICALPVKDIAADDAVLFLWATPPFVMDANRVIDAWGFRFKTVAFWWVKKNRITPSLFWGMGNWTRANVEPCLLGVRGNPRRIHKGVHCVVEEPISKHSKKPNEVRERIVKLMGDIPRIELFARDTICGWDRWGNEVQSSIIFNEPLRYEK